MKKGIALLLTILLVLGMAPFASFAIDRYDPGVILVTTASPMKSSYADVPEGSYFYDAAMWAAAEGITTGTNKGLFLPSANCTRAQMVTFLWRFAGCPQPKETEMKFKDVPEDAYYAPAVLWALETGITDGITDRSFAPDMTVSRGQTVTFLYRLAGRPAVKEEESSFCDVSSEDYYFKAVLWAKEKGITYGNGEDAFNPKDVCQRGQVITFLYRYAQ